MTETVTIAMPLPAGQGGTEAELDKLKGQWVSILAFGTMTLGRVTDVRMDDVNPARIWLGVELEEPEVEQGPPVNLLAPPVNVVENGVTYPCQPIGCDDGRHLPGCVFAEELDNGPE